MQALCSACHSPRGNSLVHSSVCFGRWTRSWLDQDLGHPCCLSPRCLVASQVLQYNETADTWSEIGGMEKARAYHAVVEVDVALFCPGFVGQTNRKPSSQSPSSPTPQYHHIHHHLLIIPTVSLLPKRFIV